VSHQTHIGHIGDGGLQTSVWCACGENSRSLWWLQCLVMMSWRL